MLLNFKEECKCQPMTINRLLEPFNQIMNFTLIFIYLTMELLFYAVDQENKVCFIGHLFGLVSGFMVGFIVLDNKIVEPWETIGGKVLIIVYTSSIVIMAVLNIGSISGVIDEPCWNCEKAVHRIWNSNKAIDYGNCGLQTGHAH